MPGSRLASGRPRLAAAPGGVLGASCALGCAPGGCARAAWLALSAACGLCVHRLPALTCADTPPSLPQGVYPRPLTSTGM